MILLKTIGIILLIVIGIVVVTILLVALFIGLSFLWAFFFH